MICSISGKPAEEPVLSAVSKRVFEKRLLKEYVNENGKDPISGDSMTLDQIIEINSSMPSYTNTLNSSTLNSNYSIPNLLSTLQNEWDAIMLENFTLRKQLDSLSKQLSIALYERDAAKIVAARLLSDQANSATGNIEIDLNNEATNTVPILNKKQSEDQLTVSDSLSKEYFQLTKDIMKTVIKKDTWKSTFNFLKLNYTFDLNPIHPLSSSTYSILRTKEENIDSITNYITFQSNDQMIKIVSNSSMNDIVKIDKDIKYLKYIPYKHMLLYRAETNNNKTNTEIIGLYDINSGTDRECNVILPQGVLVNSLFMHEFVSKSDNNTNTYIMVTNMGSVYLVSGNLHQLIFDNFQSNTFIGANLHKDGLLLALYDKKQIKIINLSQAQEPPTVVNCDQEITSVTFSSNGYWMVVNLSNDTIVGYDMRKQPLESFASLSLPANTTHWDMNHSARLMVSIDTDQQVNIYKYQKKQSSWIVDSTVHLNSPIQDLLDFKLLYGTDSLNLLLQDSKTTTMFNFE